MARELKVGLIGYKFMGKAHSHAYKDVALFFDPPVVPTMEALCGRDEAGVRAAAEKYGWNTVETDWRRLIERPDIDLVDISTPNYNHAEIAIAAARAGKHILCEKPLAMNAAEARAMLAAVQEAGVVHMICHNYRYAPAVQLARKLITDGTIGQIYHWRATYLQDWIMDPQFPLVWRLQQEQTGSGAHGDLAAHIIDLARFLVGEITEVAGLLETFIKERPVEGSPEQRAPVTVDDASLFLARFEGGAVGTFEATRFAGGNRNGNRFEINGSKGSIRWDLENMNNLQVYFHDDPPSLQGWRTINVTEPVHPYVANWWPPGHIIGYEHTFVHLVYELLCGVAGGYSPAPDFMDGLRNQLVLEAVARSAGERRWVQVEHS
ncbi:MAG: Gfo/Idh/MocA family protein [Bacillota bacterium]